MAEVQEQSSPNTRSEPFQQLLEIANRVGRTSADLPLQRQTGPHWAGIGFACGGYKLVAQMGEVVEILTVPSSTRLPRVKHWVRGVANVRGRLLPLIDLEDFFGGQLGQNRRKHRVLVLDLDGVYCGLVVDEVYGIKHFPVDSYQDEMPAVDELRQQIVDGAYLSGDEEWALFNVRKLISTEQFMDTAF